ncbi:MAG TPA: hypothetical protein VJW23_20225 [Propionibacteriaceae bacterium]|nr:hypothetical protein [Propionibacteriaceae bacterium]
MNALHGADVDGLAIDRDRSPASVWPKDLSLQRLGARVDLHFIVEEVDAGGLYACLTRFRHYLDHEFRPYDDCAFGPDIEWWIVLRQEGYRSYLDWSVTVEHCRPDGTSVQPSTTAPERFCWNFNDGVWGSSNLSGVL